MSTNILYDNNIIVAVLKVQEKLLKIQTFLN